MTQNKREYLVPETEVIKVLLEGVICLSDPQFNGFGEEEGM